jgi:hypothetical protein
MPRLAGSRTVNTDHGHNRQSSASEAASTRLLMRAKVVFKKNHQPTAKTVATGFCFVGWAVAQQQFVNGREKSLITP